MRKLYCMMICLLMFMVIFHASAYAGDVFQLSAGQEHKSILPIDKNGCVFVTCPGMTYNVNCSVSIAFYNSSGTLIQGSPYYPQNPQIVTVKNESPTISGFKAVPFVNTQEGIPLDQKVAQVVFRGVQNRVAIAIKP